MTTPPTDAGWCSGYGTRNPHWTDLLIHNNHPAPLCQVCDRAWRHDDPKVNR